MVKKMFGLVWLLFLKKNVMVCYFFSLFSLPEVKRIPLLIAISSVVTSRDIFVF